MTTTQTTRPANIAQAAKAAAAFGWEVRQTPGAYVVGRPGCSPIAVVTRPSAGRFNVYLAATCGALPNAHTPSLAAAIGWLAVQPLCGLCERPLGPGVRLCRSCRAQDDAIYQANDARRR